MLSPAIHRERTLCSGPAGHWRCAAGQFGGFVGIPTQSHARGKPGAASGRSPAATIHCSYQLT